MSALREPGCKASTTTCDFSLRGRPFETTKNDVNCIFAQFLKNDGKANFYATHGRRVPCRACPASPWAAGLRSCQACQACRLGSGNSCRRVSQHARHARHTVPGALCWCRGTFTVADLKSWAGRKMRSPGFSLVDPAKTNLAWPTPPGHHHHRRHVSGSLIPISARYVRDA